MLALLGRYHSVTVSTSYRSDQISGINMLALLGRFFPEHFYFQYCELSKIKGRKVVPLHGTTCSLSRPNKATPIFVDIVTFWQVSYDEIICLSCRPK